MLTDTLAVQMSNAVGLKKGSPGNPLQAQDKVIDSLRDLLSGCGWAVTGIKAQGTVLYPLGFPTVGTATASPKTTAGCWTQAFVSLDGNNYTPYNPFTETPLPDGNCTFFALGTSIAVGLTNLCAAIGGRYSATYAQNPDGSYTMTVKAVGTGPTFNFPTFAGDGRWGVASELSGGGYVFTSQPNTDASGNLRTAQYTVKVTSFGSINSQTSHRTQSIVFDFQTAYNQLGHYTFALDGVLTDTPAVTFGRAGYNIVANPYSFAVFCPDQQNVTSIFACAPYVPTEEGFTSVYTLFVASYLTQACSWGSNYMVCVGTTPDSTLYSGGGGSPRMLALRNPGTTPLTTPSGAPVITNAWVMYGQTTTSIAYLIGKVWDCAVVSDVITTYTIINGYRFVPIAWQDGSGGQTRCTLLFRIDVVPTSQQGESAGGGNGAGFTGGGGFSGGGSGAAGSGGGGTPSTTTVVNVINANTSTPELVWVSGPQFTLAEVGKTLYLSNVTSVTSNPGGVSITPTSANVCWLLRFGMILPQQFTATDYQTMALNCSSLGYTGNCIPPPGVEEYIVSQLEAGTLPSLSLPNMSTTPAAPSLTGVSCSAAWTLSGLGSTYSGVPVQTTPASQAFTVGTFIDATHITISPGINGYFNTGVTALTNEQVTWV